jgi:RecB family exonuclease
MEGGPKGPFILDWKTSGKSIHADMDDQLLQYKCQTGAYSLILKHMTGIQAVGGAVVVARRSGEPITTMINQQELIEQENLFLERAERHFAQLSAARALIEEA